MRKIFVFLIIFVFNSRADERSWIDENGVEVEIIKKIPGLLFIFYLTF